MLTQDDRVLAFLDIGPLSHGHALVIPKAHYVTVDQMPDDLAAACAAIIPRLSRAIMAATGESAWNVLQNNGRRAHQAVDHVHFHIIPQIGGQGLGIGWLANSLDNSDAAVILEKIQSALGSNA